MAFKVVWSPSARADLKEIVSFIAEANPQIAEEFGTTLLDATKTLGKFELLGRKVPEFELEEIREIIVAPYRVIYRLQEDKATLEIIRLWHGARGEPIL